ncbi:DNA polymerase sliding clamp [Ignicoccus hospitalis]|uniref:DNA polymerase sliding clamp n=1 Tax=Ignicoccus hospitalis (strain KIN4/I / DSM 18386 / JCM 14125) TaxID=453591 RepID=A8AA40_IGNH4|nr:DNA polymerase sliding clamp [Ignicoccus hospitalis]ABU81792.1 DNA polymerase sliding clamp subunit A [Ignicoccus hospitalis KIN4/I]HIH90060.1 DNA polymerase sliding clamp [Desulfurococcaceae archaeon]
MKIVYPEAKIFQSLVDAIGKIVDEVALVAKPEGVEMKAIDPAQVVMIRIYIPADAFSEYEVEEEESLGFNIGDILKFFKRAKKGYKLELGSEAEGSKIRIVLEGALIKKYVIPNLEVVSEELPDLSNLDFKVKALLLASVIKEAIKDIEAVSDVMIVEAPDADNLYLKGAGVAEAVTRVSRASSALLELEVEEPSKAAYDLTYLKHIVGITKVSDNVEVRFGTDMPLYLKFNILAGGEAEYVVAPQAL